LALILFHLLHTAPSRPLSAYNLFFREEKEVWMAEKREAATRQAAGIKEKGNVKKGKPKVDKDDDDDDDESSSSASDDTEPRSFEAMAKALGSRWRHLDQEKKQRFIDMATKDQQRYRREMEIYKEKLVAETVLGAAYLKKQRLQREQAAQGEDGSAPQGGQDENMQGETSGNTPSNAQVPNHIDIPTASVFASASSSGGTASSASAAAPSSSDIAQQILFLQGQQQQQILLSQLGQSPPYLVTSHDLWLQQQQLHAQQQHLQREQMILNAAVATAQRSSSQSQFQVQMGNNNSLDGATAALFLNPASPPPQQVSVELQQTLWRLQQQQQQAQESNQLHNILSQFQQQQQQQVSLSQNLAVRPLSTLRHPSWARCLNLIWSISRICSTITISVGNTRIRMLPHRFHKYNNSFYNQRAAAAWEHRLFWHRFLPNPTTAQQLLVPRPPMSRRRRRLPLVVVA
jgi:LysM repeat protein